ncbi:MAG: DUF4258 domain-containing protein [Candidatus Zixiibacteriota bacterium]
MGIKIHPHAKERMEERGATKDEIIKTVQEGEKFPAKFGRIGLRRNFACEGIGRGKKYKTKQIEVYGVKENEDFIVITILVKYF